jgi:hypothetical protein
MFKKINNKTYLILAIIVSFILASCLKDKGFDNSEYGTVNNNTVGGKWVSIPWGANSINALSLDIKDEFQQVETFVVSFDYQNPADKDIVVTLAVNNELVNAYNTANNTNVSVLPADAYQAQNMTITIPAGQRVSNRFVIPINTSLLNATTEYALGLTIQSVSDPSINIPANLKNVVLKVVLKNKYDGIYRLTGYHNRPTLNCPYDQTMHMVTEGAKSVVFYWPLASSEGHPIGTCPGVSWYGTAVRPVVVFDDDDIVTDVYNKDAAVVITRFDAATGSNVSRYDEATKTIIVHWNYNAHPERAFFDTLVYVGPRP